MHITKGRAVKKLGSKSKLARFLGINRQAVQQWADRKPIAQKYADKLVEAFGEEAFK